MVPGQEILVVDDNEDLAENVAELLELEGLRSRHFADPHAALDWADQHPFALALLDVRMPGMDGLTLYEKLRARYPKARFAFVTAFDDAKTWELAERDGIEIISKPFAHEDLVAKVKSLTVTDRS